MRSPLCSLAFLFALGVCLHNGLFVFCNAALVIGCRLAGCVRHLLQIVQRLLDRITFGLRLRQLRIQLRGVARQHGHLLFGLLRLSGSLGQIFQCLPALLIQLLYLQLQSFQLILQLLLLLSGSLLFGTELLFGLPHTVQQQLMLFGLCGERRKFLLQFPQLNRGLFGLLFRVAHAVCQISALFGDFLQLFALHTEEQQILDKMWENYELTPTAARPMAHKIDDRQEEEKTAASLRRSIKSLGPVNLAAIEEFSELSERLVFLTEQKDDLEQAERELRGIIEKLTEQMKEIFAASFAQLNRYFGETFQEIFGGGSAELALEDENDILGCGIEIRVTPPGKTLKNLSLLSGGEKAFVAIALYFAILKVRPTPFCVLDEIEAALDDVNVTRFAQYLHRLSDKTQFIVITHRRGTMEEANMLYGVTMQERGVSKLLMLNIEDVEKEMDMEIK